MSLWQDDRIRAYKREAAMYKALRAYPLIHRLINDLQGAYDTNNKLEQQLKQKERKRAERPRPEGG